MLHIQYCISSQLAFFYCSTVPGTGEYPTIHETKGTQK